MRKTHEEFESEIFGALDYLHLGAKYEHFKGGSYVLGEVGVWTPTEELAVVYSRVGEPVVRYIRPVD